jgi:hypothetical protein
MCVATVVIAIGTTTASIIAADRQARAAKIASDAQARAARDALQVQKDQYAQARADFEPYAAAGRGAVGRMQDRAGQTPPAFDPTNAATFQSGGWGSAGSAPPAGDGAPVAAQLGMPQQLGSAQGALAGPTSSPTSQPAGETTLMQAPDGSPPRPVPGLVDSPLVKQLIAKGARVVQPPQTGGR